MSVVHDFVALSLVDDYVNVLYLMSATLLVPNTEETLNAMRDFVTAFQWLYAVPLPPPGNKVDCFEHFLAFHENNAALKAITPFDPDEILQKYIEHAYPKRLWGPRIWALLHELASREDVVALKRALSSLCVLLPCIHCATHLKEWLDENDVNARDLNDNTCASFVVSLHNHVNRRLGKPVLLF